MLGTDFEAIYLIIGCAFAFLFLLSLGIMRLVDRRIQGLSLRRRIQETSGLQANLSERSPCSPLDS